MLPALLNTVIPSLRTKPAMSWTLLVVDLLTLLFSPLGNVKRIPFVEPEWWLQTYRVLKRYRQNIGGAYGHGDQRAMRVPDGLE